MHLCLLRTGYKEPGSVVFVRPTPGLARKGSRLQQPGLAVQGAFEISNEC
ncbi:hypothetical protein SZ55_0873 [Pseudomonas sp. FeS53a]|nr:hypothetical protein SZ55_0873 [Pseudomonas sp. FeS53a]